MYNYTFSVFDLHKVMASVKRLYDKMTSNHRFMERSIDQVLENDSSAADIILIGPPQSGYETDQEDENVPDNGFIQ